MIRKTAISVLLFLISVNLCACFSKEPTPEDVIEKLETAFNTSNVDMMLECYEPSIQNMYKGMMEIGGQLMGGVDMATVVSGLGGFADVFGKDLGMEMPTIRLVINSKKQISENRVSLNVTQYYDYKDMSVPEDVEKEITSDIPMEKIDGKWYIAAN